MQLPSSNLSILDSSIPRLMLEQGVRVKGSCDLELYCGDVKMNRDHLPNSLRTLNLMF